MAYEYEVDFLWQGDVREEQERMIAWLKAHGEDIVASFATNGKDHTNGTGGVFLDSIERVAELARDCGVTIVKVERIDLEALFPVPEPDAQPA